MTSNAGATAAIVETMQASSYRVKFNRDQFLELVEIAHPGIIYHRGKNHFFAYDGFLMYTQQCKDDDFGGVNVLEAIELSNQMWSA